MVVSFSQVGLAFHFFLTLFLFFFFFIYLCLLQKCNIIPQCCKEKHPFNAWNTLSPELLELVGSRITFFFGPNYFFFTKRRSFWSFDVTRNKENNNSGLSGALPTNFF